MPETRARTSRKRLSSTTTADKHVSISNKKHDPKRSSKKQPASRKHVSTTVVYYCSGGSERARNYGTTIDGQVLNSKEKVIAFLQTQPETREWVHAKNHSTRVVFVPEGVTDASPSTLQAMKTPDVMHLSEHPDLRRLFLDAVHEPVAFASRKKAPSSRKKQYKTLVKEFPELEMETCFLVYENSHTYNQTDVGAFRSFPKAKKCTPVDSSLLLLGSKREMLHSYVHVGTYTLPSSKKKESFRLGLVYKDQEIPLGTFAHTSKISRVNVYRGEESVLVEFDAPM